MVASFWDEQITSMDEFRKIRTFDEDENGSRQLWSLIGSRSSASSIYIRYIKGVTWSVYDKDHTSELRIKNRSESDPRSYEVT